MMKTLQSFWQIHASTYHFNFESFDIGFWLKTSDGYVVRFQSEGLASRWTVQTSQGAPVSLGEVVQQESFIALEQGMAAYFQACYHPTEGPDRLTLERQLKEWIKSEQTPCRLSRLATHWVLRVPSQDLTLQVLHADGGWRLFSSLQDTEFEPPFLNALQQTLLFWNILSGQDDIIAS